MREWQKIKGEKFRLVLPTELGSYLTTGEIDWGDIIPSETVIDFDGSINPQIAFAKAHYATLAQVRTIVAIVHIVHREVLGIANSGSDTTSVSIQELPVQKRLHERCPRKNSRSVESFGNESANNTDIRKYHLNRGG
jgi:hypothetical protein